MAALRRRRARYPIRATAIQARLLRAIADAGERGAYVTRGESDVRLTSGPPGATPTIFAPFQTIVAVKRAKLIRLIGREGYSERYGITLDGRAAILTLAKR